MIIQKGAAEPQQTIDYSIIEDAYYPATFFKVIDGQGKNGPFLRWVFTIDEVDNVSIFTSILTPAEWVPGKKLDNFMRVLGIDVDNADMINFDTDALVKGSYKIMLFCEKRLDSKGVLRLNATKYGPYVQGARGTEPLAYPKEYVTEAAPAPISNVGGQRTPYNIPQGRPVLGTTQGNVPQSNRSTIPVGRPSVVPRYSAPTTGAGAATSANANTNGGRITEVTRMDFNAENPNGNY